MLPTMSSYRFNVIRELKRREKQRQKDARKTEAAAKAPPAAAKATSASADEENLTPNVSDSNSS